jgi:hypothetical protein
MCASEIRNKAIPYYACFICALMQLPGTSLTIDEIQQSSKIRSDDDPLDENFLLNDVSIIEQAISFLEEENIVSLVTDEFAPQIVIQHHNFSTNSDLLFRRPDSVFHKYDLAGEGRRAWLSKALSNIDLKLIEAQDASETSEITQSKILAGEDLWEPIPLDRTDQLQKGAVEAVDRIIEELRGDNGYATTNPEEKAFVQDKLSAVAKRLKEDSQISWMYLLEFAFKPLGIVIKRFGGAAVGVAALVAKDALTSWLKSKGISFLDGVLS